MLDFNQIKEDQIKRVDHIRGALESMKDVCPVIHKLFTCADNHEDISSIIYSIFNIDINYFENLESLFLNLGHAMLDDGSFFVQKELKHIITDMKEMASNKTGKPFENHYDYIVSSKDSEGACLSESQLDRIIDIEVSLLNADKKVDWSIRFDKKDENRDDYFSIKKERNKLYKTIWKENSEP